VEESEGTNGNDFDFISISDITENEENGIFQQNNQI